MRSEPDRAPERPDEASSQRVAERRWLPAAAVTALILLVAGGARTVADATASDAGPPVRVGAVAQIQPRPGWDLETRSDDPPAARLHRGPVLLDVFALPPDAAGAISVARRFVDEALRPGLAQVTVGEPAATRVGEVEAVRFGYVGVTRDGVPVEGVVTVASGPSVSVVFDAYAPQGELVTVAEDLRAMIDGAVIG
ncbi:MAG TPA: hypothetical protein VJM84_05505 [Actinomycetota bacterium]|nr:hypothetical protein [Actinomycetota bacterium]